MSQSSKIYACFISTIGLILGSYCTYSYVLSVMGTSGTKGIKEELLSTAVLFLLYIVCRCFPIYIRSDYAVDMSFICSLAMLLYRGPAAAAAMAFVSTPFVAVQTSMDPKKWHHIFNVPFIKTAFNAGNYTISIYLAGSVYQALGGSIGKIQLPRMLLPMIVAAFMFFLSNGVILLLLFSIMNKVPFFPQLIKILIDFLPNLAAATPLGFFIAWCMTLDGGAYLVVLFMLPLMLARYSFVLYLDVKNNYYNMVKTLSAALEAKDCYTEGHSHRVEIYSEKIARKMRLSNRSIEDIRVAALLHDIGKIGIDDSILNKPGYLTPEERSVIILHPQIGDNILKNVKLSHLTREIILHHHERYDGMGYPGHTQGDEIPLEAYIVSAADAYDAMTSDRPYCNSRPVEQAMQILNEESGRQFHPKVVEAFLQVLQEEKITAEERKAV